MAKPTHIQDVMTRSEAKEMVNTILSLRGDDIELRAFAVAVGWPLGQGPTVREDHAALRASELRKQADKVWEAGNKRRATELHEQASRLGKVDD